MGGMRFVSLEIGCALCLALSGFVAVGCRGSSDAPCGDEPMGIVTAWVEGDYTGKAVRFSGTVESLTPGNGKLDSITIAADDGSKRVIRFQAPGTGIPVEAGGRYGFEVQHAGEFPTVSSIVVTDEKGLVFAGVSDWDVGANLVKDGVIGIRLRKAPAECEDRPHADCYDTMKNAILVASYGEKSVRLFHGESGELDGYRVTCLTCQDVVYNSSCADAGLITVSYMIVRTPVRAR
jgi:VCBS repeat-containing protein